MSKCTIGYNLNFIHFQAFGIITNGTIDSANLKINTELSHSKVTTNQQKDALNYQEYRFPIERSEHLNCSIKPKGEILNYNRQALGIRISKTVKLNEYQCIKPNVFLKEPHQISVADT